MGVNSRGLSSSITSPPGRTLSQRNGKYSPFIDALVELAKTGVLDQLIHFRLRATAHHPRLSLAMAGQRAGNERQLRMPGLTGINEISAFWYGPG